MNIGLRKPNPLFLFGALLVLQILIAVIFHFNGLYGQDGHEYLRLLRAFDEYFKEGKTFPHTYFPIFYPLTAFILSKVIRNDIWALQLVSMLSLTLSFFSLRNLIRKIYGDERFLNGWLICFFFFSPYVFRFGLLSMSDMLCLLFIVVAVSHCVEYWANGKTKDAVYGIAFSMCAAETRYAAVIIIIIPALLILVSILKRRSWKSAVISMLVITVLLLPDLIIRQRLFFFSLANKSFSIDYTFNAYAWSPLNFFRNTFQNPDGYQHYAFWNIVAATFNIIHPAYLFAGILFLFFMKKKDAGPFEVKWLLGIIALYGLYIAGLNYQNNRYLLLSFPFVLVVLYPAFKRIVEKFLVSENSRWILFACVIIIQQVFFWYSFSTICSLNHTEREIAISLKSYAGRTLYTCSINGALNSYELSNEIVDLYNNRLSSAPPNALLLFNYDEFTEHFKDENPMINWKFFNDHYHLAILRSYPLGWALYSIEPKPSEKNFQSH